MNLQETSKWTAQFPDDWQIEFNELYDIEPARVSIVFDQQIQPLIWEQFFSQDLLQIRNIRRGLLLDVGWYPHAATSGAYFLKVLALLEETPLWDKPLYVFETKCFANLAQKLHQILNRTDSIF